MEIQTNFGTKPNGLCFFGSLLKAEIIDISVGERKKDIAETRNAGRWYFGMVEITMVVQLVLQKGQSRSPPIRHKIINNDV